MEFTLSPVFSGTPQNLFSKFFVGSDGTRDLYAKFTTQVTINLKAVFVVRHEAVGDIFVKFKVMVFFGEGWADKKAVFLLRHSAYNELFSELIIRNIGDADLKGILIVRHSAAVELFAETVIRQSATAELAAELVVRHSASADLKGVTIIRHSSAVELYAKMEIEPVADLFADLIVRHSTTKDLKTFLYVRHPVWMWTTRRYINGVVDAAESLIGDAKLEYVIEGVMEDIQGYMEANELTDIYAAWADITLVPVLIRRATTYGTVAALYARHSKTFRSRVLPTVAPVTVTTLGDDERAMQYWQDKMDTAMANYMSTIKVPVLWTSTADEVPVFTMADIPVSQWDPSTDLQEWHAWLNQRES